MRLTIAGGGGFRVPLIYRALSAGPFAGLVRELVLYDVDASRLAAIEAVLTSLARQGPPGAGPQVRAVSSLPEALDGADMVFAAIRPGGTAGRTADERVALDLGLLGQETTGPGGISYALRSIPPMLRLAEEMRSRCPEAWLLNFTNPAGMVTEALVPVLGPRVIGICDSAGGLAHRAARAAGVALAEGRLDGVGYYGLNHLGWLYRLESDGRDALPELLADPAALAEFEEGRLFPPALLASLGCLPNEYLFYYYDTARAVAGMRGADLTRGESIARQQAELYPRLADAGPEAFALWETARRSREEGYLAEARAAGEHRDETDLAGGGYERVALAAMRALSGGGAADLILNTVNAVPAPETGAGAGRAGRAGGARAAGGRRRRGSLQGDARRRCAAPAGSPGTGATGADAACQGCRTARGGSGDDGPAGGSPRRVRQASARGFGCPCRQAARRIRSCVPGAGPALARRTVGTQRAVTADGSDFGWR